MKQETIKNIIETFRGDYNMGTGFRVTSKWVKKHDEVMYNNLLDKLWEFVATESADIQDIEGFKKGDWLVEYRFKVDDYAERINVYVVAGKDWQDLANQQEWVEDFIDIHYLEEDFTVLPVFKYLNLLN